MTELIGNSSSLGWVIVKTVLLFAVTVVGLRFGERRTLAQLGPFDFAAGAAVGAIIGRTATSSSTSFATGAVALATLLVVHRLVTAAREVGLFRRLIDQPPRVLMADGRFQPVEMRRAGLTESDVRALLRQKGVEKVEELGYVVYETKGTVTTSPAGEPPSPLLQEVLARAGWRTG